MGLPHQLLLPLFRIRRGKQCVLDCRTLGSVLARQGLQPCNGGWISQYHRDLMTRSPVPRLALTL